MMAASKLTGPQNMPTMYHAAASSGNKVGNSNRSIAMTLPNKPDRSQVKIIITNIGSPFPARRGEHAYKPLHRQGRRGHRQNLRRRRTGGLPQGWEASTYRNQPLSCVPLAAGS